MSRRSARERAFQILYQLDLNHDDPETQLKTFLSLALAEAIEDQEDPRHLEPLDSEDVAWIERVVRGVIAKRETLDHELSKYLRDWTITRLPRVDRALLRLAAWEILHDETPDGAAISEAVVLARRYAAADARRYINGVLGRLAGVAEEELRQAADRLDPELAGSLPPEAEDG
ncbi:MAG: transcription antitermination factor NusB [Bacillota bacterium]|nr:transcription antitermination factor NusB [Bacillota bacterium]